MDIVLEWRCYSIAWLTCTLVRPCGSSICFLQSLLPKSLSSFISHVSFPYLQLSKWFISGVTLSLRSPFSAGPTPASSPCLVPCTLLVDCVAEGPAELEFSEATRSAFLLRSSHSITDTETSVHVPILDLGIKYWFSPVVVTSLLRHFDNKRQQKGYQLDLGKYVGSSFLLCHGATGWNNFAVIICGEEMVLFTHKLQNFTEKVVFQNYLILNGKISGERKWKYKLKDFYCGRSSYVPSMYPKHFDN